MRHALPALSMLLVIGTVAAGEPQPRIGAARCALTIEDRVAAQRAIERVYHGDQIGATKPFEEAAPRAVLEAKVQEVLEQTVALTVGLPAPYPSSTAPARAEERRTKRSGGAEALADCIGEDDGTPCDDGNPCTLTGTCRSGVCVSPITFTEPAGSPIGVGSGPSSVASGDFNLDGRADLAAANTGSGTVTILLGDGLGGFTQHASSPLGSGSVAASDFNLDGKPDLAVANQGSNNVTILLGDGSGGFNQSAGSPIGVGRDPRSVAVSDFNLDGRPDLAVANTDSANVTVLLGDGSGRFAEHAGSPIGVAGIPLSVAVSDFNLDRKPDIAVATYFANSLTILMGDGFGGFNKAADTSIDTLDGLLAVAVGDFDLDAKPDLAVVSPDSNTVIILLGNGSGGFTEAAGSPVDVGMGPSRVAVSDFNLDGKPDLAVANSLSNTMTILLGDGFGGFTEPSGSSVRVGDFPVSVAVGDVNLDGKPDLAVTNYDSNTITILLNSSSLVVCPASDACSAGFCDPATGACTQAAVPFGATCNDGNLCTTNDGCHGGACGDAVVTCTAIDQCHVAGTCDPATGCSNPKALEGTACNDRNACTQTDRCQDGSCSGSDPVTCTPLDNCHVAGTCDPATGCSNPNAPEDTVCDDGNPCTLAESCRSGICVSPVTFTQSVGSPVDVGSYTTTFVRGDFNLDGRVDLAVANQGSEGMKILLGDGSGGFTAAVGSPVRLRFTASAIAVADINVDGRSDLAVTGNGSESLTILLGDGSGGFAEATGSAVDVGRDPLSIAAGDFDLDGKPDLAVTNNSSSTVAILLGDGAGGFTEAEGSPVDVGSYPQSVVVADLDLDGNPDLAVANAYPRNVTILLGDGAGGFAEAAGSPVGAGNSPQSLLAGDLNLDGKLDLAMANFYSDDVTILLGDGSGGFAEAAGSPVGVGYPPVSVIAGDFDLDGKPDLAVTSSYVSSTLTLLLGDGSGRFAENAGSRVGLGDFAGSSVAGDFNLDGKLDLAVETYPSSVTILLNSSSVVVCPASDTCTTGFCDSATGACTTARALAGATCNDGNPCTTNDLCRRDSCEGAVVTCTAIDQCHVGGTCDSATGCSNPVAPDGAACSDGSACTRSDACQNGSCVGGSPIVCPAPDQCHTAGTCDAANGTCSSPNVPDGTTCDDANLCTTTDACHAGVCAGTATACTPPDACHLAGTCDPATGVCANPIAPNGAKCDDGNACTQTDACRRGACVGVPLRDGTECSDGNACTRPDTCQGGVCRGTTLADGAECDDGSGCTRGDACLDGTCVGGSAVVCPVPDQCHTDGTCDPATGLCSSPNVPDGTSCDDANRCTSGDVCLSGFCSPVTFREAVGSPIGLSDYPRYVAVGNLDLDGDSDLVVVPNSSGRITILLGDGSGKFTEAAGSPVSVGGYPSYASIADFNLDGNPDLAVAMSWQENNVKILLGDGSGRFAQASGSPFGVGDYPNSIAVSDFNLDGKPDLAIANRDSRNVTILLGDGSGGFDQASGSPEGVESGSNFVATSDFNLDGKPDLAVANNSVPGLTILLGDGSGGFTPVAGVPIGLEYTSAIAVSDFNLDGKPDLAASTQGSTIVLLGDGTGGFSRAPGSSIPASRDSSPAVSDFNLDGKPDLAVTSGLDSVLIFLGDGSGRFTPGAGAHTGLPYYPGSVVAADFNRDGRPDLAVEIQVSNMVTILLGSSAVVVCPAGDNCDSGVCDPETGACGIAPAPDGSSCSDGNPCTTNDACDGGECGGPPVACSRLDQCHIGGICDPAVGCSNPNAPDGTACSDDGNPCTSDECSSGSCAHPNQADGLACDDGNGCTQPDSCQSGSCVGAPADGLPCNDANACTRTDTCQGGSCAGGDAVVCPAPDGCHTEGSCDTPTGTCQYPFAPDNTPCNDGNACTMNDTCRSGQCVSPVTFVQSAGSPHAVGSTPASIVIGEFNLDGHPDMAVANVGSSNVTILLGDGTGGFVEPAGSPVGAGAETGSMAIGDFNLDGRADLAVVLPVLQGVAILLGDGSGRFAKAAGSPARAGDPGTLVAADFNADGKPDLAVVNHSSLSVTILLGDGALGFTEAAGSPLVVGSNPVALAIADVNVDGKPDLVTVNSLSNDVSILLGDGSGKFAEAEGSPERVGFNPSSVAISDFNLDGRPDLAVANSSSSYMTILLGSGSGSFVEARHVVNGGGYWSAVVTADFNLDGKPDLAANQPYYGNATILLGNGTGGFSEAADSPVGTGWYLTSPVAVSDVNLDGKPDLAVVSGSANSVTVWLGSSDLTVCPASEACVAGVCDPTTGGCAATPAPAGTSCSDGNACTTNDACRGGACGGVTVTCTAADACHVAGTCDAAAGCSNPGAPEGTACSDDNACTQLDACRSGSCVGDAAPEGTACDDHDPCTRTDSCAGGRCAGGDPVACVASDQCHVAGVCDPATGTCSDPDAPNGAACNDDSLCTAGDICGSGNCGPPITFAEALGSPIHEDYFSKYLLVSDFNLDGKLDLANVYYGVHVLLGDGLGGFVEASSAPISLGFYASSVAVSDFNLDGIPDLAMAGTNRPPPDYIYIAKVKILLGTGSGSFVEAAGSPIQATGRSATSLVVSDFNVDGRPDLVMASAFSDYRGIHATMMTLMGNGTGGFTEADESPIVVEGGTFSLVSSDLNLDGRPDLALFSYSNSGYPDGLMRVFLGAGSGSFFEAEGSPKHVGRYPSSLMVSEFNLDGKPDLAFGGSDPSSLTILLGDGAGGFAEAAGSPIGGVLPRAFADFNLDGKPDLAVTKNGGPATVAILLGDGAGMFTDAPGSAIPTQYYAQSLVAADLNFDGKPDLAAASDYNVTILLGTANVVVCQLGDVCHADLCEPTTGACTSVPAPVPDGSSCSDGLSCTTNDACRHGACSGTSIVCTPLDPCHVAGACDPATGACTNPNAPEGTACSDGTACTQKDACRNGSCVGSSAPDGTSCEDHDACTHGDTCHLGSCAPGDPFVCPDPGLCHSGSGVCDPATGDCSYAVQPDGTVCDDGNACTEAESCVSGACAPEGSFTVGGPLNSDVWIFGTVPVHAADFNLDGRPDLAVLPFYSPGVTTLLGNGSGGFEQTVNTPIALIDFIDSGVGSDFNLDGKPDLAVLDATGTVTLLLGDGTGGFAKASGSPAVVAGINPPSPWCMAVSDFNLDGKPDLAVAEWWPDDVKILLGDGAGGFTEAMGSPVGASFGPAIVAASDVNLDGRPDLVVMGFYYDYDIHSNVTILLGDGSGGFSEAAGSPFDSESLSPTFLTISDLNLDGKPDLVVSHYGTNGVRIWQGDGSGRFAEAAGSPVRAVDGYSTSYIVAEDFNLDGKPDLAVNETFDGDGDVALLLGDGTGGFTRAVAWPGVEFVPGGGYPVYPVSLVAADLDVDGKPDLVVGNSYYANNTTFESLTILLGNPSLSRDGTSCSDGDYCTTNDVCSAGTCEGGPPQGCDDGDPCTVDNCDGEQGCVHTPDTTCNHTPLCSAASPSPGELWPPDNKMVPVAIAGVSDPDGDPVAVVVTGIAQDEPVGTASDGACPDGAGVGTSTPLLRAERDGHGDGRVYTVSFAANDARGGECEGTVTICVPHDQGRHSCGDQGPSVNSTDTCAAGGGKRGRPQNRGGR